MDKRHLDLNYINELKEKSKTDENSLRELLKIQEIGKSSLIEISHEFEIPVKPYIDSLNIYKNNNITNFYCRKIVEEYSNLLKNTDSKKYEKTSIDHFSVFDYSSMSNINESFNKIIEKKLIKQYYTSIFSILFDNIDDLTINESVSDSIGKTILETFNKSKKENDWISINMVSLKLIEPLVRELFIKNNWLYKKSNLKNKTLGELLDSPNFRDKYPNICNGLKMILCDYLGLNLRNSEFHNLTENSSNPIITKISFICISSILDLFEDINIEKYYKISKSKIETNDYKPLKNDINSHLEAINYIQWEFMSDRKDPRIDKVFSDICIPNGVNQKELDIDFSKYSVEEFLKEIMKLKN
ncbi:MAG: DUF4209 domain-containing protein [Ignavibacteria bacterium]|nr:DUF4209 domain-containing protein [Ignavibacteria bacterium]